MIEPLVFTRTILESNGVSQVLKKEQSKILGYSDWLKLIRVYSRIKDVLSYINSIYNNNDVSGLWYLNSLVDTISNSKEFSFSWSDIDSMINCLSDVVKKRVNMRDECSNIVSNTSIQNNNDEFEIQWCIWEDIIKFTKMSYFAFLIFVVCLIKRESTRKIVN